MGIFRTRREQQAPAARPGATLGSGRRLRSSADLGSCLATLHAVVEGYRPRKYEHLPLWVDSGFTWLGSGLEPSTVISGQDGNEDFLLVALWPVDGGTEAGMFPLGSGDQRLNLPIIGHWKMRDPSLTSVGQFPASSIALRAPRIPTRYLETTLTLGGAPATPANVAALLDMTVQQMLVKSHQFISSQDQRQAQAFVAAHRDTNDLQGILDDLGAWNPGVLPYIQDLPLRIRGLMLSPEIRRRVHCGSRSTTSRTVRDAAPGGRPELGVDSPAGDEDSPL